VRHERHGDLYWFGPPERNPTSSLVVALCGEPSALEEGAVDDVVMIPSRGAPGRLILGYKSISIYSSRLQLGKLIKLDCLVLYSKYLYVLAPTCQVGEGPLTGRRVFW
jgi:hypothetical protein